ncbi:AI-2E family transporter [Patulibacter sp. SYSU D01012]|uniref:AI-2E family transporter n=1 Tax=Patulibacter sp. SYSU D01012 TaxID=2817381 RepID=UPI001B305AF2
MRDQPSIPRVVLTITLTVLAVLASLVLLYLLRKPLSWIVIAGFIAIALSGPVQVLSRRLPRGLAITAVYLLLFLVPALILLVAIPPLVRGASDLIDQAPEYARQLQDWVEGNERLRDLDRDFGIVDRIQEQAQALPNRVGDAASWLGNLGLGIVNSVFAAVTILILSVFLVANGRRWIDAALAMGPRDRAERLGAVLDRMGGAVGAYLGGALLQAAIAGVLTWVVLTILGVPFAVPLAVLVALFDLLPMVGATIGAVLVGIITLFGDFPTDTIVWVVWSIVYQQVENTVIQPRIQNRAVGVHPFVVMVAVLFGGTLLGIPGALLAVPVAAAVQIAFKAWWDWRHEDADGGAGERPAGDALERGPDPATDPAADPAG